MRVLRVLEREQFIWLERASGKYSLGAYLYVLGSRAAVAVDLLRIALPHLRQASDLTGLTCSLSQRASETELVYIAKEEPKAGIHISVSVGETFPIVAGSHGKCHLAFMSESESADLISSEGIAPFTKRTITDPQRYLAELRKIRRLGYATSFEEWVPGINGLSVPIIGRDGIVAAMSASGTSAVVTPARIRQIAPHFIGQAAQISADVKATNITAAWRAVGIAR